MLECEGLGSEWSVIRMVVWEGEVDMTGAATHRPGLHRRPPILMLACRRKNVRLRDTTRDF